MDTRKRERLEGFGFHSKGTFKKNKQASEEVIIDLVHPDIVPELRGIANLMFNCNYDQEPSLKNNQNPPSPLLRQAQICRDWKLEKLGDLQRLEKMRN
ncbi:exocyst complex component EXO70B1-like [Pyrus ussuriensis x Pyrus communis]|uniref:Exocyst complex component EXO70B1-like n=1 Tax=Pyrus ussuriensis x Pyrus communis TaxID=2448454 RepID=A0A5N5EUR9_9ROSA|nr:exocyst complex component EXO70B1-like [Pyrus ussuriensis x Pyrus communis]